MPEYKLSYFPLRSRAEPSRLLLTYGGIKFQDIRVTFDEWATVKATTPMGQLPVLEVDGVKLCQTTAIARYLAKEFGLAGKTHLDQAKCDMLLEGIQDMWAALRPTYLTKLQNQPENEPAEWKKFKTDHLKGFLDRYAKFLHENSAGWFVGNEMTYADIGIAEFLSVLQDCFDPNALSDHSELKQFVSKVFSNPKLKDYIAKRPKTAF